MREAIKAFILRSMNKAFHYAEFFKYRPSPVHPSTGLITHLNEMSNNEHENSNDDVENISEDHTHN